MKLLLLAITIVATSATLRASKKEAQVLQAASGALSPKLIECKTVTTGCQANMGRKPGAHCCYEDLTGACKATSTSMPVSTGRCSLAVKGESFCCQNGHERIPKPTVRSLELYVSTARAA